MGTVPFSNPAGNNQMSPPAKMRGMAAPSPIAQGNIPGAPGAVNPLLPTTGVRAMATPSIGGTLPTAPTGPQVPNTSGLVDSSSNTAGTTGALEKQLTDIYGKGTGGALASLLSNMSGVDSATLQNFIASLQPQMATAQANTNAALGAGGVSSNSSVAAIADANLQAQEFGAISEESAQLTQSQEQLTAQILEGTQSATSKEVASSGWSVFGDVMNQISGDVGDIVGKGGFTTPGNSPQAQSAGLSSAGYSPGMGADISDAGIVPTDPSIATESILPFGV